MKDHVSTAKITKPTVSEVYEREHLFQVLDKGRKRPIVWVSSPAGSGKTTLVASYLDARKLPCLWYLMDEGDADPATFFYYLGIAAAKISPDTHPLPLLTPEYLQGIPVFTKRFFERLCQKLKPPILLVLDNYQDVPKNSIFHEIIIHGLEMVPAGINVVIVSRKAPPPSFARLQANNKMDFVGWNEIRFTLEESREIVRAHGRNQLSDEAVEEIYRKTQGWMAGLVLLMEGAKRGSIDQEAIRSLVPETIFDYFASEIFDKTDSSIREFLLKTALLPSFSSDTATKLTGIDQAEQILSRLYKNHYFIEKRAQQDPVYHYHPLFREFLISKAKTFYTTEQVAETLRTAAGLLEEAGQIEHAALLLREAKNWERLATLILKNAESLFNQGRAKTLLDWLESLPKEMVNANPWILYWTGMSKMPFNLGESRTYFETAFHAFKIQKDIAGLCFSWTGVVNSFVYEWGDFSGFDKWIREMEMLLRQYPHFPSPEIEAIVTYGMFTSLMYREPHHPDLPMWEERLVQIVMSTNDVKLRTTISAQLLLFYSWLTGQMTKVASLVNLLKAKSQSRDVDPVSFIVWRSYEAAYYWLAALDNECLHAVTDGLKFSEEKGIHVSDSMFLGIGVKVSTTTGNPEQAQEFLQKMAASLSPTAVLMLYFYHYVGVFVARLRGDLDGSIEHGHGCLKAAIRSGMPFALAFSNFVLGSALLENNERKQGLAHLDEALTIAVPIKCYTAAYLSLISKAKYFLNRNEIEPGLDVLAKTFEIGRQQGFFNNSAWRDSEMSFLCAQALEAGIEVEHVRELIRRRNLVPDAASVHIENWPWPLRIYALGQFRIEKDGKPLSFNGKVQKKPLELLQTLIACGSHEVSEIKIADALWPDADGDAAHRALITTLQRLRKLLGNKEILQLKDGFLSLDPRHCWVDANAFDHLFRKAGKSWKEGKKQDAIESYDRALDLYKGPLLGREFKNCDITVRESMREKFIHCLKVLGETAEQSGSWERAVSYYLRALETDDGKEEIYRFLMVCYAKAGRYSSAMDVYDRCRRIVHKNFGIEPSSETNAIFQSLKAKTKIQNPLTSIPKSAS